MRTLKKALCMVLAVVMILGLGAFGVAADFTDAESISSDYTEAVDLLNAIGVIKGEGDGSSFNPEGELTRAQGAAIITRLMGYDEKTLPQSCTFTDVAADHWAIGAIGYCESEKIVGGMGDGTFHPNDTLTGYQFTKMLLTAAGYDAASEGLTGDSWEVNTQKLAKSLGLDDGVTLSSKAVQRQEASQLGFNALTLNQVRYTGGTDIQVGDTTIKQGGTIDYLDSFMADNFGLKAKDDHTKGVQGFDTTQTLITGVVTANSSNTVANKKDGTTTLTKVLDSDVAGTYATDTGIDLLGHYVQLYVTGKGTAKEKVLTVTDLSKVVEVPTDGLTTAAATAAAFGATTDVVTDTVNLGTAPAYTANTSAAAGTYVVVGTTIVATINPAYIEITGDKVDSITETAGSEAIVLAGAGTLNHKADDDVVNPYDGIAKDDYVVVTKIGAIYTLTKAETVEGKITKNANGKLTVNGTAYAENDTKVEAPNPNSGNWTGVTSDTANFTDEFTLYLDGLGGYFLAKVKGEATPDATLVYAVAVYSKKETVSGGNYSNDTEVTKYYLQGVNMNGEEVNLQIYKGNGTNGAIDLATPGTAPQARTLYKVTTSTAADTNNKYNDVPLKGTYSELAAVTEATTNATESYSAEIDTDLTTTTTRVTNGDNKYYLNNTMKVFYISGTLANLKVTTATGKVAVTDDDIRYYGTATTAGRVFDVQYVFVPAAAPTATVGKDIMYLVGNSSDTKVPYTDANGETQTGWFYTAYIDGTKTEITVVDTDGTADYSEFVTYTVENGVYTLTGTNNADNLKVAKKVTGMHNGLLTTSVVTDVDVNGATVINLSDNTKVPTDPTKLNTDDTVALVLNSDETAATIVYVIDSDRA